MSTTFIEEFDEYGNVKSVANIQFTDKILGEGSFGIVRLAKRSSQIPILFPNHSLDNGGGDGDGGLHEEEGIHSGGAQSNNYDANTTTSSFLGSSFHSEGDIWNNKNFDSRSSIMTRESRIFGSDANGNIDNSGNDGDESSMASSAFHENFKQEEDTEDEIVAVKIYSKLVLKKMREMTRSKRNKRRMSIHDALEKVEKEIAIMKLMNHPNIVKLYEVIDSSETETLYIVLEYIPLGQIMKFDMERERFYQDNTQFKGLTSEECYDEYHTALFFVDVLHGLEFLHQHHICHRDLKPENILVDSRGYAKISDFGVSHVFEDEVDFADDTNEWGGRCMSQIGNLTKREGTYSFWSPEMCNAKSSSFSGYTSDIWACGICLHIFACGKLPFYAHDPSKLFDLIIKSETPQNTKFSKSLNSLIGLLLEKDPDERVSIGETLEHPFCKQARMERMIALGPELMQRQLNSAARKSILNRSCTIQ